jgi:hypothetical protein
MGDGSSVAGSFLAGFSSTSASLSVHILSVLPYNAEALRQDTPEIEVETEVPSLPLVPRQTKFA